MDHLRGILVESYRDMEHTTLHPAGSTILVLEDDRSISELLVWVLSEAGYEVTAVSTVREAIRACRERLPDVIVADLLLPDGMGSELLDELRERSHGGGPPSIVMSALPNARRHADAAGARACLAKPFDLTELLDAVSRLTKRQTGSLELNLL